MIAEWFPMLLGMTNASFRRLSAVPVCARHIHETRDCTMSCSQSSHTSLQWMRLARVGSTAGCNQALQTSKYRELHGPTLLNGRAAIQHQPEMILHLSSNSSGAPVTDRWANKFLMPGVLPSKSKQNKCWTGLPWTHPNWSEPGRRFDPLILPHLEQKWNVFDVFTFLGIGIFELEDFWFCRSCWCILSASHVESVLNLCFPRKNNYQGLILRCDKFHKCNHSVIKMSKVWWCLMFPTDQTEPQSLSCKRWTAQRFFLSAKRSCRRPASISTRMTSKCYMHFFGTSEKSENIWKHMKICVPLVTCWNPQLINGVQWKRALFRNIPEWDNEMLRTVRYLDGILGILGNCEMSHVWPVGFGAESSGGEQHLGRQGDQGDLVTLPSLHGNGNITATSATATKYHL